MNSLFKIFALTCFIIVCYDGFSQQHIEEIHQHASKLSKAQKIRFLNKSSENFFRKDIETANKLCTEALKIAEEIKNDTLIAQSHKYLAFIYRNSGYYKTALTHASSANEYFVKLKDSIEVGFTYSLLGSINKYLGNRENALAAFIKAEFIYQDMLTNNPSNKKVKSHLSILYNDIGLFYFSLLKDYENAHNYFSKALTIAEQLPDSMQITSVVANIGMVYYRQKQYTEALEHYKKAFEMARVLHNEIFAANISNNIANIYIEKGVFVKARQHYRQSLEIYNRLDDIHRRGRIQYTIGNSWYLEKQYNNAINWYKNAIPDLQKSGAPMHLIHVYNELYESYQAQGKTDSAFHYFKVYSLIKDSIHAAENEKRFQELFIKYETEKKEKENEILKQTFIKQKAFQRFLILLITAIIILTIILILYFLLKRKNLLQKKQLAEKENQRLNEKLEFRNKELTTNAMYLVNLNLLSESIVQKIRESLPHTDLNGKQKLQKIIKDIELNVQHDAWKEFELRFEQVHTEFYEKLNQTHPSLTPTEIKTCAFLRLNMSSKDIAALSNKSVRTVEKLRANIRKKMELPTETNLVNYLASF